MLDAGWSATTAVSGSNRVRRQRILREAEGYLELGLPQRALHVLGRMNHPGTFRGHLAYLTGESLRALERYEEALVPLEEAADMMPSNIHVWLALGWCRKRLGRLDLAIEALQRAEEVQPSEALIQYNLACYCSLSGAKNRALGYLSRALSMNPRFRELIHDESDFDPIRSDPEFRALTSIVV